MANRPNEIGICEDAAMMFAILPSFAKGIRASMNGGDFDKNFNEGFKKAQRAGRELDEKHGDRIEKEIVRTATKVATKASMWKIWDIFS